MSKEENANSPVMRMRHTLAHAMAAAVRELYPDAKFGIGPAIETGFYYDIDFGTNKVTEADLARIEKKMRGIVARKLPMSYREVSHEEAMNFAIENKQELKK